MRTRQPGERMLMLAAGLACALAAACASAPHRAAGAPPELPLLSTEQVDAYLARLTAGGPAIQAAAAWSLGDARTSRPDVSLALQKILAGSEADDHDDLRAAALWALYRAGDPSLDALKAKPGVAAETAKDYDEPPKLIKRTKPVYPKPAYANKKEGMVPLVILIDVHGRVALLTTPKPNPWFDKAAIRCVAGWRFTPARRAGQPVAVQANAPVSFRIF